MKARLIKEKGEFATSVVFAENRNKAKYLALSSPACENAEYTDIEAYRLPIADSQYNGRTEMGWFDPDDRRFLVKECDFCCDPDYRDNCDACSGKHYCSYWQEQLEGMGAEE